MYSRLLHRAGEKLKQKDETYSADSLLRPLYDFAREIPNLAGSEGVGIFRSKTVNGYCPLLVPVENLVVVADSFHIKPMMSLLQDRDKFFVLAVSADEVTLALATDVSAEKLAVFRRKPHVWQQFHTQGTEWAHGFGNAWAFLGGAQEDAAGSTRAFFDAINRKIHSGTTHSLIPMVLIGNHATLQLYRQMNTYPVIFEAETDWSQESPEWPEIYEIALHITQRMAKEENFALVCEYLKQYDLGHATDELQSIARSAAMGEVETLLVDLKKKIWGHFNRQTGEIKIAHDRSEPLLDDILDDVAQVVISRGGRVVTLDSHDMPGSSGAAAILKLPRVSKAAA
jgi:hypothetical protein